MYLLSRPYDFFECLRWVAVVSSFIVGSAAILVFLAELIKPQLIIVFKAQYYEKTGKEWINILLHLASVQTILIILPIIGNAFSGGFMQDFYAFLALWVLACNIVVLLIIGFAALLIMFVFDFLPICIAYYFAQFIRGTVQTIDLSIRFWKKE